VWDSGDHGRIDTDLARRCLATIRHRDLMGRLWQDNGVTLGHRRLAILDTSEAGRQPMSYANQRYWITFNGEIYNFIEIRAELEGKGIDLEQGLIPKCYSRHLSNGVNLA